ncbi:MAG: YqcC family protein [Oleiphilaceae bacterium]|nr:YqcC family protein [Oleiphilaceae bacterium]
MRSQQVDQAIHSRLDAIAGELRQLALWQETPPPESALSSHQPFCVDTLTFQQWVQFVLLPKMRSLLEAGQPLPHSADIAPMAEESFRQQQVPAVTLVRHLRELDRLITENP